MKHKLTAALLLLESVDINGHACTCSGCEADERNFNNAMVLLREALIELEEPE